MLFICLLYVTYASSFPVKYRPQTMCLHPALSYVLSFVNATFTGLPAHQYRRLQSVLSATARLIYQRRRFDHVTPLLRDLHWLKVPERVAYKLAMTVYQCLHGMAPPYLCDGLQCVAELNQRLLRSSVSNALVVPSTRLITVSNVIPSEAQTTCLHPALSYALCFMA